jgi:hypothetical protein
MKTRTIFKPQKNGTKRAYLVRSLRVGGKPRQKVLAYVDGWPKPQVERLKKLFGELENRQAKADDETAPKADRRKALASVVDVQSRIDHLRNRIKQDLAPQRQNADRRRSHLRHTQVAHERNPFCDFIRKAASLRWHLSELLKESPLRGMGLDALQDIQSALQPFAEVLQQAKATESRMFPRK